MKMLIVDDEFVSRKLLLEILSPYGSCDEADDGEEAVAAVEKAWADGKPYDLLCLDITMPKMDGQEALAKIRAIEEQKDIPIPAGVKIIMSTGMNDSKNILGAFKSQCDAYIMKPIEKDSILKAMKSFGLMQ